MYDSYAELVRNGKTAEAKALEAQTYEQQDRWKAMSPDEQAAWWRENRELLLGNHEGE